MRNITITLDEEAARWARVEAARRDMSVSRLFAGLLEEYMGAEQRYDGAMHDYLSRRGRKLKGPDASYPSRDERHDRVRLR